MRKKTKRLKTAAHRRTYMIVKNNMADIWDRRGWSKVIWRSVRSKRLKTYEADGSWNWGTRTFSNRASWKDATRNHKQWMKKKFTHEHINVGNGTFTIVYAWKSY